MEIWIRDGKKYKVIPWHKFPITGEKTLNELLADLYFSEKLNDRSKLMFVVFTEEEQALIEKRVREALQGLVPEITMESYNFLTNTVLDPHYRGMSMNVSATPVPVDPIAGFSEDAELRLGFWFNRQ